MENPLRRSINIGFISFRFQGTDGVSLETAKWAEVLEEMGHTCFYFSGLSDRPPERSMVVEDAHFLHPEIRQIFRNCFGKRHRSRSTTKKIQALKEELKDDIYEFINKFNISLLVPQNALTIPLNIREGSTLCHGS